MRGTRKGCILILTMTAMLVIVPTANAAKGGGGKGHGGSGGGGTDASTIGIVLLNSTDGLAHFGQEVTFSVSTTSTVYPWVAVKCSQDGALVYEQANGIFTTSLNQVFTLGPTPSWQSGAADCTAYLQDWDSYSKNGKIATVASMAFHAYA